MCGIAGLALTPSSPPPDPAVLAAMARALAHRGPDGAGSVVIGQTALVHARLAIIDVAGGDQPLFAGQAALVANGEIYNYRELRAALPGVAFATGSDCEPPLHLFRADGERYAARLRGMFAIAIHDRAAHTLTLTRDPFGIKPLYYLQMASGVAFASEPQALLAAGLAARAVRPGARDELLQMQFTTGAESIFPGIVRLLPGETISIADGRLVERRHIAALPEGPPEEIAEDAALARLDRALMESVDLHQRSDVPYGMFLSGGIDSACVLAAMARLNERPVLAYTAGFDVPGAADERAQARAVARSVGAHHEAIEISRAEVWRHLPAIVAAMDDPAADYAIIPSWFLARRARQDVKVVLSGEGGDEIFGGYGRYRSATRPWYLGGRVMRGRGNFDRVDVLRARPLAWRDGLIACGGACGARRPLAAAGGAGDGHRRLAAARPAAEARPLPDGAWGGGSHAVPRSCGGGGRFHAAGRGETARRPRQYLLRTWLARALPASEPFAPKQGFTVPVGAWIAADGARLGALVADQPGIAEIAVPDRVRSLFRAASGKREGKAAWSLLFYALWHQAHVLARAPEGDVFEALRP